MSTDDCSTQPAPFIPPPDAPEWFLDNIQQPGESVVTEVEGTPIHTCHWNRAQTDKPVLLLLHGFSGHTHWWSFLAPFFTDRYRVVAMDLPGMGDSGHLPRYHDDCFARAICGAIRNLQLDPVTVVGHSFGGVQSIRAMARAPELFSHGIIVDSLVFFPPEEGPRLIAARETHRQRSSREECQAAFRLSPPQPGAIEALVQFVGFHSCHYRDGGWQWKFDPGIQNYGEIDDPALLGQVTTPVDVIYGALSMFNSNQRPQKLFASFPNRRQLVIVPDAHHHLMLDQPLQLVATLKDLLD